jgi:hypothetical protein
MRSTSFFDKHLPDYLSDLNAMREAILAQSVEDQWMVFVRLTHIVPDNVAAYLGNASQYAEAFLYTMGRRKK